MLSDNHYVKVKGITFKSNSGKINKMENYSYQIILIGLKNENVII